MDATTLIRKNKGVETHMVRDGDKVHCVTKSYDDHQAFFDDTARKRAAGRAYYAKDPELQKLASVPVSVIYEWLTKYGVNFWDDNHWPAITRLLNSNEYRYLKTAEVII